MKFKDLNDKKIHFIGVGGIGMSGIAQLLAKRGMQVSGSDLSLNSNTERLQGQGIEVMVGHDTLALEGKDIVVVSSDIKEDNAELMEARLRQIPVFHRSEMLSLLMEGYQGISISGTHGKTTTTALLGWVFEQAGLDPTIINGGVMNVWRSNVKLGQSQWCVTEADESDGSFLNLPRKFAVVTNMDPEHMDYYKTFERLYDAFEVFTTQIDAGGAAILGIDHPQVYSLWKKIQPKQRCITYGQHPEADVRAERIHMTEKGAFFELIKGHQRSEIFLSLYGHHNVMNALAVAAVAFECGIDSEILKAALASFEGVQRLCD